MDLIILSWIGFNFIQLIKIPLANIIFKGGPLYLSNLKFDCNGLIPDYFRLYDHWHPNAII